MLGHWVRRAGDRIFRHTNTRLTYAGVGSKWAYALALVSAAAGGLAFAQGSLWAGLALLVLHGFFDYLDGGLRRARGEHGPRPRWLGMDAHAVVDKVSEVMLCAGIAGGRWTGWPLAMGAAGSSIVLTLVGGWANRWLGVDPQRALFDRSDRLFVLLASGAFGAFDVALVLVCVMNGVVLLQRAIYILRAFRTRNRAA